MFTPQNIKTIDGPTIDVFAALGRTVAVQTKNSHTYTLYATANLLL